MALARDPQTPTLQQYSLSRIRTLQGDRSRTSVILGGPAELNQLQANVAELVDALDLGSSGVTREGSSPSFRTRPVRFKTGF